MESSVFIMPWVDAAAGVSEPLVATLPQALKPRHIYSAPFRPVTLRASSFPASLFPPLLALSPPRYISILPEILYTNKFFS